MNREELFKKVEDKYPGKTNYTYNFIVQSIIRYGDIFSYEKTERVDNNLTKVIITCPIHGDFLVDPNYFLNSPYCYGCPKCNPAKTAKKDTKYLVNWLKINRSEYDLVEGEKYINNTTKVKLFCKKHNEFFSIAPANLFYGKTGCKLCYTENQLESKRRREELKLLDLIHSNFPNLDTTKVIYMGNNERIELLCNSDGVSFSITPRLIKDYIKQGEPLCPSCREELYRLKRQSLFVEKALRLFPTEFDFSNIYYINNSSPATGVYCTKCGSLVTITNPNDFLSGAGNICPNCNKGRSNGERIIEHWLLDNNIDYKSQVRIKSITGRREGWSVCIDFVINYNSQPYWVEYHGEQHYTWCKHFHKTLEDFSGQLIRDANVRDYCFNNNIKLIEIPWTYKSFDEIYDLLEKTIINNQLPSSVITFPEINYNRGGNKDGQ